MEHPGIRETLTDLAVDGDPNSVHPSAIREVLSVTGTIPEEP